MTPRELITEKQRGTYLTDEQAAERVIADLQAKMKMAGEYPVGFPCSHDIRGGLEYWGKRCPLCAAEARVAELEAERDAAQTENQQLKEMLDKYEQDDVRGGQARHGRPVLPDARRHDRQGGGQGMSAPMEVFVPIPDDSAKSVMVRVDGRRIGTGMRGVRYLRADLTHGDCRWILYAGRSSSIFCTPCQNPHPRLKNMVVCSDGPACMAFEERKP